MVTSFVILFVFTLNRIIIDRSICSQSTKDMLFYVALVICLLGELFLICTALADSGTLTTQSDEECASLVGRRDAVPYCDACMMYQTNNAAHCTFCDCCVEDLDHHCTYYFKHTLPYWSACMKLIYIYCLRYCITLNTYLYVLLPLLLPTVCLCWQVHG